MKKDDIFISIVIPNCNGERLLKPCLDSISNQSYQHYEVIVVDNGSADNSVEAAGSACPLAKIVTFSKNRGFSIAVNEGIRRSKGEYIFLLNNDTALDEKCLKNIASRIQQLSDGRIGSLQCCMINFHHREKTDSTGIYIDRYYFAHQRGLGEPSANSNCNQEIWGVCAGAAVYKREMLDDISINGEFFDENFFAFYEDTDLNFRANLKGWRSLFIHNAIVYHVGTGTSIELKRKMFLLTRNRWFTIIKNVPFAILKESLKKGGLFDRRSYDFYKGEKRYDLLFALFYGHIAVIYSLVKMLKKRYYILSKKSVGEDEIRTWFV